MKTRVNDYPGKCRLCGRHVDAGQGAAHEAQDPSAADPSRRAGARTLAAFALLWPLRAAAQNLLASPLTPRDVPFLRLARPWGFSLL